MSNTSFLSTSLLFYAVGGIAAIAAIFTFCRYVWNFYHRNLPPAMPQDSSGTALMLGSGLFFVATGFIVLSALVGLSSTLQLAPAISLLLIVAVSFMFIYSQRHGLKDLVVSLLDIIDRMVTVVVNYDYGLTEHLSPKARFCLKTLIVSVLALLWIGLWHYFIGKAFVGMWTADGISRHLLLGLCLLVTLWIILMLFAAIRYFHQVRQNAFKPLVPRLSVMSPQQAAYHIHVAHLSDLHIPSESRLTEKEPWEEDILSRCTSKLDEKDQKTPFAAIVFSGDITDTGDPAAWDKFQTAFGSYKSRIVLAPGNHDLNIVGYGDLSILLVSDKPAMEGRWKRMYKFMDMAVQMMESRAKVWQDNKLVDLPGAWDAVRKQGTYKERLKAANALFPFVVTTTQNAVEHTFIVWNTVRTSSLAINNSFGSIGKKQLENFRAINNHFKKSGRDMIHVMHHKVGLREGEFNLQKKPPASKFGRRWHYVRHQGQLAGMTMHDAHQVISAILDAQSTVVLHGHHHATFSGQYTKDGKVMHVVSAPSSTIGTEYYVDKERLLKGFDILELGCNSTGWALMHEPIPANYDR